jgi:hypothetical protein
MPAKKCSTESLNTMLGVHRSIAVNVIPDSAVLNPEVEAWPSKSEQHLDREGDNNHTKQVQYQAGPHHLALPNMT